MEEEARLEQFSKLTKHWQLEYCQYVKFSDLRDRGGRWKTDPSFLCFKMGLDEILLEKTKVTFGRAGLEKTGSRDQRKGQALHSLALAWMDGVRPCTQGTDKGGHNLLKWGLCSGISCWLMSLENHQDTLELRYILKSKVRAQEIFLSLVVSYLWAVWKWVHFLTFLCLSFFICKTEMLFIKWLT